MGVNLSVKKWGLHIPFERRVWMNEGRGVVWVCVCVWRHWALCICEHVCVCAWIDYAVCLCGYEWGKTRLYLEGEICICVCRGRD